MTHELSTEARRRLTRQLQRAADAARERNRPPVRDALDAVRDVTAEGTEGDPVRERLVHGCEAVERTIADEPLVAAEYLEAMASRVGDDGSKSR